MKSLIAWAVRNYPAMNTIVIAIVLVGVMSAFMMRREVFPNFDLEIVLVTVPYPGATPTETEEGICQKIEEGVLAIQGIKKITTIAKEGAGYAVIELENGVDVQKALSEVRSEVDRIPSFPALAEDPEVKQITFRAPAIRVGVIGPDTDDPAAELRLREVTEEVRQNLLMLPSVSQANIIGERNYQIDIEISEETLRKYGLTLARVAEIVRRENIELPSGTIRTSTSELLLRGKNRHVTGPEIAKIPLVTLPSGAVLTVGDLGVVRDEFLDDAAINKINGRPGLVISIDRAATEDLVAMCNEVNGFVEKAELPAGYSILSYRDTSIEVVDRLDMLLRNGLQGLIIVFFLLALFLETRLAFWVAVGIPLCIFGACAVLFFNGDTLNMLSMFGFLMVLGMVVDDAIVVGENIHVRRQLGEDPVTAAINGTVEVIPSVTASVLTTIICFIPLFFVSGVMGKFIAIMPLAIIATLLFSLFESAMILPVHLAEPETKPTGLFAAWKRVQNVADSFMDFLRERIYLPSVTFALRFPLIPLSAALLFFVGGVSLVTGGHTPWVLFPEIDSNTIEARIGFPDGTSEGVTDAATQRLEAAIHRVDRRLAPVGGTLIKLVHRTVGSSVGPGSMGPDTRETGSHVGTVSVELVDTTQRRIKSDDIIAEWRRESGEFAGAERLIYGGPQMGPGGKAIEFKLLAPKQNMAEMEEIVEQVKQKLETYTGVHDVVDDSNPGKIEFQLRKKDTAHALDVTLADLSEAVRSSYYGEEAMRLQRGRHEVKLMVRYPREERRSLAAFNDLRVRGRDGAERPLTELAEVTIERGYSEINRVEQLRSITISANVNESVGNAAEVTADLEKNFMPGLLAAHPEVRVRWEGQARESSDSMRSMMVGLAAAALAMFVLLSMEFRSYYQPFIILAIIPFAVTGAIYGHLLMGLPLTIFTAFGAVALCGIVVNDSIVLIDFVNVRREKGATLIQALTDAGARRLRPIMLTSLTTAGGLFPILMERSLQAQVVIPMAVTLVFGLLSATVLCLYLIPTFYYVSAWLMTGGHPDALVMESTHTEIALGEGIEVVEAELDHGVPLVPVIVATTAANGHGNGNGAGSGPAGGPSGAPHPTVSSP